MGFWKSLFSKEPRAPRAPLATQPEENQIPLAGWDGQKAGYVLVRSQGKQNYYGGALDLFRKTESMVSKATDAQKAELVQWGRAFQAEYESAPARAVFEGENPEFVAIVNKAIRFGQTGA